MKHTAAATRTKLQLSEPIADETKATAAMGVAVTSNGRSRRAHDGGVAGGRRVHGGLGRFVERLGDGREDPGDGGEVHGRRGDLAVEAIGRRGGVRLGIA